MEQRRFRYIQKVVLLISLAFVMLWVWACATLKSDYALPARHPLEEGEDIRFCLKCHEEQEGRVPYARFEHSMFFSDNHGQLARSSNDVCTMCHRGSFCSDCHGVGVELKPSIKNQTENYRRMPHRGDYLSRHQIDGRINPVSCYRCHGNPKTSATCKPCHG